jgi:superfamily I DNA/RNA helicase
MPLNHNFQIQSRSYHASMAVKAHKKAHILDILSAEQKRIVSDPSQYIIVAAGPGTGKTVCAAGKVVHLIQKRDVKPEEILVLTQGEKSARQIQHLVDLSTNMTASSATIRSVSSFCSILLDDYGVSSNSIPWVKEEHLVTLVEDNKKLFTLSKYNPQKRNDLKWRDLVDHFAKLESFGVTSESYATHIATLTEQAAAMQSNSALWTGRTEKEKELMMKYRFDFVESHKEIADAYTTFINLKSIKGKFALTDRLPHASSLISQPSVRSQLLSRYKHIIVDQLEDWGKLDWKVLETMALFPRSISERSFTFFGDDDCAIMEWAGAPRDAFQQIRSIFTDGTMLPLTTNYRCNIAVLEAARSLISNNVGRLEQASGVLKSMVSYEGKTVDSKPLKYDKLTAKAKKKAEKEAALNASSAAEPKAITINLPTGRQKYTTTTNSNSNNSKNKTPELPPVYHLEFKTESDEVHGISDLLAKLLGQHTKSDSISSFQSVATSSSSSSSSSSLPTIQQQLKNDIEQDSNRQTSVAIVTRFKTDALNLCKHLQTIGAPVPSPLAENPEIKFIVNILKTVLEPSDAHGLYDLLCSGMFSIPGAALAKITELHQRSTLPLRTIVTEFFNKVLQSETEMQAISKEDLRILKKAKKLLTLLNLLDSKVGSDSMQQLVYRILKETNVLASHRNPHSEREEQQSDNIAKFITLVEDTEKKLQNTRPAFVWSTLKRVCTHTPTGTEIEDDPSVIPVRTAWASKSYEYDYVIVPYCTDDRFPGRLKRNELQELLYQAAGFTMKEDEHVSHMRRVLYTAMTRARKGVIFTYHAKSAHGKKERISRFVPEALGVPSARYLPDRVQPSLYGSDHSFDSPSTTGPSFISSSQFSSLLQNPGALPPPRAPTTTTTTTTTSYPPKRESSPVFGGGVFTLESTKLPAISLHGMQVFLRCPLQFYQQFILNVAVPNTPLAIFQEAIGAVIHSIASQEVDNTKLSSFDKLRKTFDATWKRYSIDPVRNPEMYEQGMALSETLLDSDEGLHDLIQSNTEWRLGVNLATPSNPHTTSSPILISNVTAPESSWSANNPRNSVEFADSFSRVYSDNHVRYYLQYSEDFPPDTSVLQNLARVIAWVYYKHNKATPSRVVIEYITARFQMKLLQFAPSPQHMIEAENYLNSLAKQLISGKFEANASPPNCKRCPFSNTCPSSLARTR